MDPVLRITSDGAVRFLLAEPEVRLDLNELADPLEMVGQILLLENLNVARARLLREATEQVRELERLAWLNQRLADGRLDLTARSGTLLGNLEDLRIKEGAGQPGRSYWVSGWARDPGGAGPAAEVVLIASQRKARRVVAARTLDLERADVALALSDSALLYSGWTADLDLEMLAERIPGRFIFAAYALDRQDRKAYKLAGELEVQP